MVLIGEARRAGDSVLLARRSPDEQHPDADDAPPLRLSKFHAPEIVFGPNSLAEAAHAAVRLGARRPFVVTDPGLMGAGWPAELLIQLRATGLHPARPASRRSGIRTWWRGCGSTRRCWRVAGSP